MKAIGDPVVHNGGDCVLLVDPVVDGDPVGPRVPQNSSATLKNISKIGGVSVKTLMH